MFSCIFRSLLAAALLLALAGIAQAGQACTWSEALLALERGNQVRGMALMKMAARDGDTRAVAWLQQYQGQKTLAMSPLDAAIPTSSR